MLKFDAVAVMTVELLDLFGRTRVYDARGRTGES